MKDVMLVIIVGLFCFLIIFTSPDDRKLNMVRTDYNRLIEDISNQSGVKKSVADTVIQTYFKIMERGE